MGQVKWRLVRVCDFVAESLEAEAKRMPPSDKEQAISLREMAKKLRQSDSQKMVRICEEPLKLSKLLSGTTSWSQCSPFAVDGRSPSAL